MKLKQRRVRNPFNRIGGHAELPKKFNPNYPLYQPEKWRFKDTRSAYVEGANPFVELHLGSSKPLKPGAKGHVTYVVPPIPVEFEDGNCSSVTMEDRAKFFLGENSQVATRQLQATRDELFQRFCSDCPIQAKCFDWAMAYEEWGIWAGTTELDRRLARKDKELREFGRSRLLAGYVPFKSATCRECKRPITQQTEGEAKKARIRSRGLCAGCGHRASTQGHHKRRKL